MELAYRDLFTVERAAKYLEVSQSSIRSRIPRGKIEAWRFAGKREVPAPNLARITHKANKPGTLCIPRREGQAFRGVPGFTPAAAEVIVRRDKPPTESGMLPLLFTNASALVNNRG